jgi:catechol 2,3-dioxygenase-like lactoylglutathione lyase family enzyme
MIIGLDHVQITVPKNSENEARIFYCGFLGFEELDKPENRRANGGFWLRAGNLQVHVGLEDKIDRGKTKAHAAYRVENLEFWRKKLTDAKFELIESAPFPHAVAFEFRDPFGNRVELIQLA